MTDIRTIEAILKMGFNKLINFRIVEAAPKSFAAEGKRSLGRGRRQMWLLVMALLPALGLSACASNPLDGLNPFEETEDESNRGTIGFVQGFFGGIAVDEPRASLVGRDILTSGGSAADVAVAVSFALSVTKPSSASLGGGGICLVHDEKSNETQTLDFLPRAPTTLSASAVRPTAVPGMVRGLAVLHAKYGKLPWSQLVRPAETLARFGNQVSRAFAADLGRVSPATMTDPEFLKVFGQGTGGKIVQEGDFLKQLDLSAVLGRLRGRGAGDFYTGLMGRKLAAAAVNAGGTLDIKDLRSFSPQWRPTLKIPYIKNVTVHFPDMPGPSGVLTAQMMGMLMDDNAWDDYTPAERRHLLAEASGRASYSRRRWLQADGTIDAAPDSLMDEDAIEQLFGGYQNTRHTPLPNARSGPAQALENNVGTSFVAVDREGSAVACALTLNNPFGDGRIAQGMGIVFAALPGAWGRGPDSLSLMLAVNNLHNIFYFGGAATGSNAAAGILAGVSMGAVLAKDGEDLETAIAARRVYNSGDPDITYYESGLDDAIVSSLGGKGHRLNPASKMGLVNAIFCATGVPNRDGMSCSIKTDPRGFGLASGAE